MISKEVTVLNSVGLHARPANAAITEPMQNPFWEFFLWASPRAPALILLRTVRMRQMRWKVSPISFSPALTIDCHRLPLRGRRLLFLEYL